MSNGKPNNALRKALRIVGVVLYRLGLAKPIIKLRANKVRALLYHAVEDVEDPFTKGLNVSVSSQTFAANLDYFQRYYNVVPMSTLVKRELPERALVITFDDGYHSVYQHAVPALVERNMSACVYLITRAVNGELVWVNLLNGALQKHFEQTLEVVSRFPTLASLTSAEDILSRVQNTFTPSEIETLSSALREKFPQLTNAALYANPAEIEQMKAQGIEFGFHTKDHYNLENCSAHELEVQLDSLGCDEITNSNTFAYPFGNFNTAAVVQLDRKNYAKVMTVGNNNDAYSIKHLDRTEVFTDDSASLFAQLEVVEPIVSLLRKWMIKPATDGQKLKGSSAQT